MQIPWLFAEPMTTQLEWKARYHGFLHINSLQLAKLRKARDENRGTKTGRRRIALQLQACEQHRRQVSDILAPADLDGIDWPADATDLLSGKLPRAQGLASYTDNIFRDWAWNNGENEILYAIVERMLAATERKHVGSILTLGGGAGRLPYDLHRQLAPELSVVVDLNPLLVHVAATVTQGNALSLYEFPIAPLDADSFAVLQECRAPVPLSDAPLYFILADAINPPFAPASFDTVVTPWLIDILPQDLRVLIPRINHCLAKGGVWVNTGSLSFAHDDVAARYSQDEVLELLEENGFEVVYAEREKMPYLQSPYSAYGRIENVFSFAARKVRSVDAPERSSYVPEWILDTSLPVPASTEAVVHSSNHLLQAQVMTAIDGKHTIRQIARSIARQYGLGKRETTQAVRRILLELWEQNASGKQQTGL